MFVLVGLVLVAAARPRRSLDRGCSSGGVAPRRGLPA
jgi:hypothetical protein